MTRGKQDSEQVLARRMLILRILPDAANAAGGLSTSQLIIRLNEYAIHSERRAVERDLVAIHAPESVWRTLGVELQVGSGPGRTRLWSHSSNTKGVFLHAMSNEQALMLSLAERDLKHFMPQSAFKLVEPYFNAAERILNRAPNRRQSSFKERIRIIGDGPERQAPKLNLDHLGEINEALFNGEQLDMRYWAASAKEMRQYRLHPVGLVRQGLFYWLLAVKHGDSLNDRPTQTFRLDRIESVARRRYDVVAEDLPTLDQALDNGELQFFQKESVQLTLRFVASDAGKRLCNNYRDAPMGSGQQIVENEQGGFDLTTTVRHTFQLLRSLQSNAHLLQVLAPRQIRDEVNKFVLAAAALQLN